MEMPLEKQKPSDVLAEQRASNKLVKLIRKLRWMRMEEEAERVQMDLAQRGVPPGDSVVAVPHETD
jgi:hypothetical protein